MGDPVQHQTRQFCGCLKCLSSRFCNSFCFGILNSISLRTRAPFRSMVSSLFATAFFCPQEGPLSHPGAGCPFSYFSWGGSANPPSLRSVFVSCYVFPLFDASRYLLVLFPDSKFHDSLHHKCVSVFGVEARLSSPLVYGPPCFLHHFLRSLS